MAHTASFINCVLTYSIKNRKKKRRKKEKGKEKENKQKERKKKTEKKQSKREYVTSSMSDDNKSN